MFPGETGKMPIKENDQDSFSAMAAGACSGLTDSRRPPLLLHVFKQETTHNLTSAGGLKSRAELTHQSFPTRRVHFLPIMDFVFFFRTPKTML